MLHTSGRVLRHALQRALAVSTQRQQQTFHGSARALARKSRRSGPSSSSTASAAKKTQAVFGEDDGDNDDEVQDQQASADQKELEAWFNQMQQASKKGGRFVAEDDHMDLEDDDGDDDDDDVDDKETEEFLSEVDDLFTLEPEEFERRMQTYDKRHANSPRRTTAVFGEDTDEDADEGAAGHYEDEHEIDRATERIPKRKLLKVLDDFQPSGARVGKNSESMALPKTKNSTPLEKKPKKVNVDRVSYRQERIELSVTDFVQSLLLQDSDSNATNVVANIVEASVAPDLRRVVLFWEPQRLNSENQTISKRKVAGIEKRLQSQERWIRMQVTRHLNLKYSPNVQFKQRKSAKSDEARAAFDREMDWLNRF